MEAVLPIFIVFAFVVVCMLVMSRVNVPEGQAYVIERNGQFHAVFSQGMHYRIPMIDQIVCKADIREQLLPVKEEPFFCQDDKALYMTFELHFRIADPEKFCYKAGKSCQSLKKLTLEGIKTILGDMPSEAALTNWGRIESLLDRSVCVSGQILGFDQIKVDIIDLKRSNK